MNRPETLEVRLSKGLGLEAQKEAVQQRLNGGRWQSRANRPQLDAALAACKKHKAKLIVAKLDRLSRNVSFLLKLIESGVEVLFADLPELNGAMGKFVLITMANVAELEAGLISERTKAALKAAKARGVRLGCHGAQVLAPKYREGARQRAVQATFYFGSSKGARSSHWHRAVERLESLVTEAARVLKRAARCCNGSTG